MMINYKNFKLTKKKNEFMYRNFDLEISGDIYLLVTVNGIYLHLIYHLCHFHFTIVV